MRIPSIPRTRAAGLLLATATAVVSGLAIYLNGHAVRAWVASGVTPTGYTTIKNLLAGLVLTAVAVGVHRRSPQQMKRSQVAGLTFIAIVGGAIPFVLFFEGLSKASSGDAAFIHKTLVVWVAILAIPLLGERLGSLHFLAIGLLLVGQTAMRGVADVGSGVGEIMILVATAMWAIEAVVARRLLRSVPTSLAAAARMAGGGLALFAFSAVTGSLGGIGRLTTVNWVWVAVAALVLSAYVGGLYGSLARIPAVDVMALMMPGAVITALLQTGFSGAAAPSPHGAVLMLAGGAVIVHGLSRRALE